VHDRQTDRQAGGHVAVSAMHNDHVGNARNYAEKNCRRRSNLGRPRGVSVSPSGVEEHVVRVKCHGLLRLLHYQGGVEVSLKTHRTLPNADTEFCSANIRLQKHWPNRVATCRVTVAT